MSIFDKISEFENHFGLGLEKIQHCRCLENVKNSDILFGKKFYKFKEPPAFSKEICESCNKRILERDHIISSRIERLYSDEAISNAPEFPERSENETSSRYDDVKQEIMARYASERERLEKIEAELNGNNSGKEFLWNGEILTEAEYRKLLEQEGE